MLKNDLENVKLPTTKFSGFYRGIVEDNNDPSKMGRVRARIFGLHTDEKTKDSISGIPTSELPWAEPVLGIVEGSISGYGLWSVPVQGSQVFIFFENENYGQPRYFGTVPGIVSSLPDTTKGFNDPDGTYPESTGTDYPSEAIGDNYPNVMVLKTHGGVVMEIDNTDKFFRITHPSGTVINLDNSGNKTETIANNKTETISGDKESTISGDKTETISGNKENTISGDKTETISGNKTESMIQLTITASGQVSITGTTISLTGNTTINGGLTGNVGGSGGSFDGTITITGGNLTVSSGDVEADGISLKNHVHSGVTAGGSNTGTPVSP